MRSKLFYSQTFGILLLLLLVLLVVPKYSKIIPNTLKKRVEIKLEKREIHWASIRVKDRDIVISGIAPTLEEHHHAISIIKEVQGIRLVTDKISPRIIAPYTMNISYDKKKIKLTGYMPTKKSKNILLSKISNYYKQGFIDEIDIGAGEPKKWNDLVLTVAKELKKFDLVMVNIVDNVLHISGKMATKKEKFIVKTRLKTFEKSNFKIYFHMVAMDESAKVCQEKFDLLLKQHKIEFQSNKAIIKASNHKLLEELSDVALFCPNVNVEVLGHTDSLGNDSKNKELSLKRAKAVVAKLFSLGIPLERLSAEGIGEEKPIADNLTKEGRAINRRIEFKVKEKRGK
jgi:OOP family OmpA-OmpF porin